MIAVASLVSLAAGNLASAQVIEYDTIARSVLGPELWRIPVSGQMTISEDASTILLAGYADTTFYLVDATNGDYRAIRSAPPYVNREGGVLYTKTYYSADANLTTLWVMVVSGAGSSRHFVIDLDKDSLLYSYSVDEIQSGQPIISKLQDRVLIGNLLYRMSTFDLITTFQNAPYNTGWFDDSGRKLYRSRPYVVEEIDPVSGNVERSWEVESEVSYIRRPRNSKWLYVFMYCVTGVARQCGNVRGINLISSQEVLLEDYYGQKYRIGDAPLKLGAMAEVAYGSRFVRGLGGQPLWSFDAASRKTHLIVNPTFEFMGDKDVEPFVVTTDFEKYLHGRLTKMKDSSITRCNLLVPNTVWVNTSDSKHDSENRLVLVDDYLEIHLLFAETFVGLEVYTAVGQRVTPGRSFDSHSVPLRLDVSSLTNGMYYVVVNTTQGMITSRIVIAR